MKNRRSEWYGILLVLVLATVVVTKLGGAW